MGWKASLIIIENKDNFQDEASIIRALGGQYYISKEEVSLDECIYPNDDSVNIGYYNGNIIISANIMFTAELLESNHNLSLMPVEKNLVQLFPTSEIIIASCMSVINYHGYALIKNGEKIRLKAISSESEKRDFGKQTKEEEEIYKTSYQKDGQYFWKYDDDEDEYEEAQLMEDFTFGFAERLLGVRIDGEDGDELMENVVFRKYIPLKTSGTLLNDGADDQPEKKQKNKYRLHIITVVFVVIWYFLRKLLNL